MSMTIEHEITLDDLDEVALLPAEWEEVADDTPAIVVEGLEIVNRAQYAVGTP